MSDATCFLFYLHICMFDVTGMREQSKTWEDVRKKSEVNIEIIIIIIIRIHLTAYFTYIR